MLPSVVSRGAGAASALLLMLLVGSCGGGDGGGDGTVPTISPTGTRTAVLPSPTRSPTRSPDATETAEQPSPTAEPTETAEQPSPTAEPTETAEQPSPTAEPTETAEQPSPSAEPTESTPESTPEETEEAGGEPDGAAGEEPADDEGVPTWVWWLLLAIAVGSAVAIPFVVARRRRNAWRLELAATERELAWLARELLPGLRHAGSREQVTGGWAVGRARVSAAEDQLTALEATAPGETDREQARSYRDAARQAREQMEQLTGPGPQDTWALDLDEIIANLELVLQRAPA